MGTPEMIASLSEVHVTLRLAAEVRALWRTALKPDDNSG